MAWLPGSPAWNRTHPSLTTLKFMQATVAWDLIRLFTMFLQTGYRSQLTNGPNLNAKGSATGFTRKRFTPTELRILKKYPNRRLYDTQASAYVTLEDVRKMVLEKNPLKVIDSKTEKDLTRTVLLQIISEQETEGHEPLLTNRVLEAVIRFYGDSMQGLLGRYIEQSLMTFLEQQELYQRRMRDVLNANPLKLMGKLADNNLNFLKNFVQNNPDSPADTPISEQDETPLNEQQADPHTEDKNDRSGGSV